jgi:hypothetical protein
MQVWNGQLLRDLPKYAVHPGGAGSVVCTDENVVFHLVSARDVNVELASLVNGRATRLRDKDPTKLCSGRQVCILSIAEKG